MSRPAFSRSSSPRPSSSLNVLRAGFVALLPWLLTGAAVAQTWETAANNPSDPQFVQMPYEVVFVSSPIVETGTCSWEDDFGVWHTEPRGVYEIGTDVLAATRPSQGNQLWVVTRNGAVKLLFPLPVHETQTAMHPDTGLTVPLIDTPSGMLELGSVVEPNVSEDGERIIFGYFHDTSFHVGSGQGKLAKQGADLYTLDLSAMVQAADPDLIDPATLPVRRLTFKEYDGTGAQSDADKNKDAQNPVAAATSGNNGWGTVNIHGTEMRTRYGLKMVYVSGERRNLNSNQAMGNHSNYNLNLKIADIKGDGSLGASRQFQYYTTTSALSPTPLRNGVAFSYQATTEDGRNWHIQHSDSEGRWGPLIGYGTNPDLFHLGAFCVDTLGDEQGSQPGDYFVATKYYNLNNNGFGALWKIDMDQLGLNTYDNWSQWGDKPAQVSARKISLEVEDGDFPSKKDSVTHQYYGKMTTPRCGRPNELFFAYTPTSANGKSATCEPNEGNNIYRSYIGFRPNLGDFQPLTDISVLVNDSDDDYNLTWPVPVLNNQERTGDTQQQTGNSIIGRRSVVTPGAPYAQVGTSSLYNTDRKPYDCWMGTMEGCPNCCGVPQGGQTYYAYNPNKLKNNQKEQIWRNYDALSFVQDSTDFCQGLAPESVLGIAVNITSNRIDHSLDIDYETDGHGEKETVRLLGVYDVRQQDDQSFQAMIPSHTPFEFHLLDSTYGLRAVDVRSWHSLYPREVRTNCGGCHQHEVGQSQPFQGTVAAGQPPLDMVNQTQIVSYDRNCRVQLTTDATKATEVMPEWKADIYPQFDQYCGSCHNSTISSDVAALGALTYTNESQAYNELESKNYANAISGALGSPAFWAARGERTDGRDNSLYQSGAVCGSSPTFAHSSGHAANPNLCGQNNLTMAQWVYRLGQWIDNHMPRDTGTDYAAKHDRYHPALDIAAIDGLCQASKLRVGYWDDSGSLAKVEVLLNGAPLVAPVLNVANGSHVINGLSLSNGDRIEVIGEDGAGNRQMYEKKVKELKTDCNPNVVVAPGPAQPWP